ncbi:MAG TPA: diguanylate cyclase, partial [Gammaproteobacteria bacterium]|nr:diguanylate cyclase [Gammaproteobacteria bacterium]
MSEEGNKGPRDDRERPLDEGSRGHRMELLQERVSDFNVHGGRMPEPEEDREQQLLGALHELRTHQEELRTQNEALMAAQRELEESQRRYLHLFEYAPIGYLTLDGRGVVQELNLAGSEILGQPRGMIVGKPFSLFLDRRHRTAFNNHVLEVFRGQRASLELEIATQDRDAIPLEFESRPVFGPEGEVVQCWAAFRDIARRRQAEADAELAQRIIQNAHEGVMVTDPKGVIISVNPCFEKTTGYGAAEAIGKTPDILHSGQHDQAFYQEMWRAIENDGHWQGEIWNRRKDGEIYPEWLNITAIRDVDDSISHYVGIFSDLSTHEAIRERLHNMAYYDSLTGLANRDLFYERLKGAIAHADRYKQSVALAFLDLDRFKLINDNLGHRIGDELLRQVGDRLRASVRGVDSIARMGGDEFTVVLPGITSVLDSVKVARKLLDALSAPFNLEGGSYHVYASIGISHYPDDGTTGEELLKHADVAMYRAKEKGRNTYQVFESEHKQTVRERLRLENELRRALDNHEFEVHYQPQAPVGGGNPVAVEALVRWRHPERGLLAPGEFIGMAEENGLIVPIGRQ